MSSYVRFQVLERSLFLLPELCFGVLHVAVNTALVLVQLVWSLHAVKLLRCFDVRPLKVVPVYLEIKKL